MFSKLGNQRDNPYINRCTLSMPLDADVFYKLYSPFVEKETTAPTPSNSPAGSPATYIEANNFEVKTLYSIFFLFIFSF